MRVRHPFRLGLAAGALLLVLGLRAQPGSRTLAWAEARSARKLEAIHKHFAADSLAFLWTFDEAEPIDTVSGARLLNPGTVGVPGRFGAARRFDGREGTFIANRKHWGSLGDAFTLALWINPDPRSPSQDMLWGAMGGHAAGFRLHQGRVFFDLPSPDAPPLSFPYRPDGTFVHLAATVDSATQTAALYLNGVCRATGTFGDIVWRRPLLAFGRARWHAGRHPLHGVLDDSAAWKRPLSANEIAKLARSRNGLFRTLCPRKLHDDYQSARRLSLWLRAVVACARFDLLGASQSARKPAGLDVLPWIRLVMSGEDQRHFLRNHHRSRLSGRRIVPAAAPRRIHAVLDGAVTEGLLALHGTDVDYANEPRPSYVLETASSKTQASRRLLLRPPESAGWMLPLVKTRIDQRYGTSTEGAFLCRLGLNGQDAGVYLVSDFSRQGVRPGELEELCATPPVRNPEDYETLFRRLPWPSDSAAAAARTLPITRSELKGECEAVAARLRPLLLGDARSPLSRKARQAAFDQALEACVGTWRVSPDHATRPRRAADFLDAFLVCGTNLSPDRLVSSLDLDVLGRILPGLDITWRSLDPDVLRHDGTPVRPASGGPVPARLVARIADASEAVEKELRFRVMPDPVAVSTLAIWIDQTVNKAYRIDAAVEICEAGEDEPSRRIAATQGSRGGIQYRGNTSYFGGKKLFNLALDAPHGLFGEDGRRTLLAINGRQDKAYLCNALAFGLFRDFAPGKPHRVAPQVAYAEVFVNGRYHGLFEWASRLDDALLDATPAVAPASKPPRWTFLRHESVRPVAEEMRVRRPARGPAETRGAFLEFRNAFEETDDSRWTAKATEAIDLENFIDFHILLNLTQNLNGAPFEFLLHEALVFDAEATCFFYIPWDFDGCLQNDPWQWIGNATYRRLARAHPDYRSRIASRWRELRGTILSNEALHSRVDALALPLQGYADWDFKGREHDPTPRHAGEIARIHRALDRNLKTLDRILPAWVDAEQDEPPAPF